MPSSSSSYPPRRVASSPAKERDQGTRNICHKNMEQRRVGALFSFVHLTLGMCCQYSCNDVKERCIWNECKLYSEWPELHLCVESRIAPIPPLPLHIKSRIASSMHHLLLLHASSMHHLLLPHASSIRPNISVVVSLLLLCCLLESNGSGAVLGPWWRYARMVTTDPFHGGVPTSSWSKSNVLTLPYPFHSCVAKSVFLQCSC
jgi:hypothetical protein